MEKRGYGYLYLINTVLFFSTYEAVSKTLVGKIDAFQINFIRFLIGGLILLIYIFYKESLKISRKDLLLVLLLGFINVVVSMSFIQLALFVANAKASVVAVIFSSNPIFVIAFSALIDKEKITAQKLIGLFTGLFGIIIIFINGLDLKSINYLSPLFALLSAASYGLYTVIGRKVSVRIGSLKMNSYSSLAGSLMLLPVLLILNKPVFSFDYSGIVQVIYLSVFVTGLAYLTYFKGLTITGASSGSLVFFAKPAIASIIAVVFLHETLTPNLIIGTVLIILGIVLSIYFYEIKGIIARIFGGIFKRV